MSGAGVARLFVAAESPPGLRTAIDALRSELSCRVPGARWSRAEGIHLTFKFLGGTPSERIEEIGGALAGAAAGAGPIRLRTGPPGLFESRGRPRVLWVALEGDLEPTVRLQASIEAALEPLGFAREKRPFHPHLTLARFDPAKRTALPSGLLESVRASLAGAEFPVREIVLFESFLSPGGSRYLHRASFGLGAPGSR